MFGLQFFTKKFKVPYLDERDGMVYAPLRDGASSPSDNGDQEYVKSEMPLTRRKPGRGWSTTVIFLLIISNVLSLFASFATSYLRARSSAVEPEYMPKSAAITETLPTQWKRFNWWTEYTEKNFTETDPLWDAINPAHGFIAMDRTWAKERHWPDSMHLPSDDSKNVYLLEAYHLLHCITIIRKTFWEAIRHEEKYTFNPPHAGHCIDTLRQYVICKADNTPLYVFGDDTAGDEQYRKCKNWDNLRQYATDNSACYRDTPPGVDKDHFALGAHFGYCDGGIDNVIDGARRGPWKHGAVFDGPE